MRYTSGSWKKFLFLTLTGFSLLPSAAMAEDARGKFTLAREVRWSTAILPAGNYSYSVEHHATGTVMLRSLNGGPKRSCWQVRPRSSIPPRHRACS